jgi:hypothetical protein
VPGRPDRDALGRHHVAAASSDLDGVRDVVVGRPGVRNVPRVQRGRQAHRRDHQEHGPESERGAIPSQAPKRELVGTGAGDRPRLPPEGDRPPRQWGKELGAHGSGAELYFLSCQLVQSFR